MRKIGRKNQGHGGPDGGGAGGSSLKQTTVIGAPASTTRTPPRGVFLFMANTLSERRGSLTLAFCIPPACINWACVALLSLRSLLAVIRLVEDAGRWKPQTLSLQHCHLSFARHQRVCDARLQAGHRAEGLVVGTVRWQQCPQSQLHPDKQMGMKRTFSLALFEKTLRFRKFWKKVFEFGVLGVTPR